MEELPGTEQEIVCMRLRIGALEKGTQFGRLLKMEQSRWQWTFAPFYPLSKLHTCSTGFRNLDLV